MQTFLPYPDFEQSARCLDRQRLGKQRVEAWQIYKSLTEKNYGWKNHPAVRMWKGYELSLLHYGLTICGEWTKRGYKDKMTDKFTSYFVYFVVREKYKFPPWFGNKQFHASHRSNLLRKNPEHYKQFKWKEPDNLPYYWPIRGGENGKNNVR